MSHKVTGYLNRVRRSPKGTGGELTLIANATEKELELFTVERPWLNNLILKSCIRTGEYVVKKRDGLNRELKYPDAWEVLDVHNRTGILFHAANHPSEVFGCIAPNKALKIDSETVRGYHSVNAVDEMNQFLSDAGVTEFRLIIK